MFWIFFGAIFGSLIFYLFDEVFEITSKIDNNLEDNDIKHKTVIAEDAISKTEYVIAENPNPKKESNIVLLIDSYFGLQYYMLSLPFIMILITIISVLEVYFPFNSPHELNNSNQYDYNNPNIFTQKSWPPWISGALVGLLQLPAKLANNKGLGSATSTYALLSSSLNMFGIDAKVTFWKNSAA